MEDEKSEIAPPEATAPFLPLRVVLIEPQTPGNVGAVARVMANFGAKDLVLVFPSGEPPELRGEECLRRARWASPLVERATVASSLSDALRGCGAVYGSSSHPWPPMRVVDAASFGADLLRHAECDPMGLVLGRENSGLTCEEQALCGAIVTISTRPVYRELNLSHAAAILLYEAQEAFARSRAPAQLEMPRFEEIQRFLVEARRILLQIDFLREMSCEPFMRRLQAWLGRKEITQAELSAMRGMAHRVALALDRARPKQSK